MVLYRRCLEIVTDVKGPRPITTAPEEDMFSGRIVGSVQIFGISVVPGYWPHVYEKGNYTRTRGRTTTGEIEKEREREKKKWSRTNNDRKVVDGKLKRSHLWRTQPHTFCSLTIFILSPFFVRPTVNYICHARRLVSTPKAH